MPLSLKLSLCPIVVFDLRIQYLFYGDLINFIIMQGKKQSLKYSYALVSGHSNQPAHIIEGTAFQIYNEKDNFGLKPNTSKMRALHNERCGTEDDDSLKYSTARPMLDFDCSSRPSPILSTQSRQFNLQNSTYYNMESNHRKIMANKMLMVYNYSNFVIFQNHLGVLLKSFKRTAFQNIIKRSQQVNNMERQGGGKISSFHSRETQSSHQEFPWMKRLRKERKFMNQQFIDSANTIKGWIQSKILIIQRLTFNRIRNLKDFQKTSGSLSYSLQNDIVLFQKFCLTEQSHQDEISIFHELPHRIQESIIQTFQHHRPLTKKELNLSTLDYLPSQKRLYLKQSSRSNMKEKSIGSLASISNASSPFTKLELSIVNSSMPKMCLPINYQIYKHSMNSFIRETSLFVERINFNKEASFENEIPASIDNCTYSQLCSHEDQLSLIEKGFIDAELAIFHNSQNKTIENSGKYSEVSNYTVDKQQVKGFPIRHHLLKDNKQQTNVRQMVNSPKIHFTSAEGKISEKIDKYYFTTQQATIKPIMTQTYQKEIPHKSIKLMENDHLVNSPTSNCHQIIVPNQLVQGRLTSANWSKPTANSLHFSNQISTQQQQPLRNVFYPQPKTKITKQVMRGNNHIPIPFVSNNFQQPRIFQHKPIYLSQSPPSNIKLRSPVLIEDHRQNMFQQRQVNFIQNIPLQSSKQEKPVVLPKKQDYQLNQHQNRYYAQSSKRQQIHPLWSSNQYLVQPGSIRKPAYPTKIHQQAMQLPNRPSLFLVENQRTLIRPASFASLPPQKSTFPFQNYNPRRQEERHNIDVRSSPFPSQISSQNRPKSMNTRGQLIIRMDN